MAKKKSYVVWEGRTPGIYATWQECEAQVKGITTAKFKAFPTPEEAEKAYREGWKKHWGNTVKPDKNLGSGKHRINYDSISVDVGTRGNPGPVEYKGVDTRTGETIFSHGPIGKGTNNLGEFLAIVHALAYLKMQGSNKAVYSDSMNAIKWVKQKKVSTTLERDASTEEIWKLIDRAERWLRHNEYDNPLLKWDTKAWGEIKADYGRK